MKLRIGPAELLLLLAAFAAMNVDGATSSICPPQIVWDRVYGGTEYDYLSDIATTGDGGFIAAGSSYASASSGVPGALGGYDVLVVRTDATGAQIWRRLYGGTRDDGGSSLAAMDDGGFILGANSSSPTNGMKTGALYGLGDYWLVRLGPDGSVLWDKTFGGTDWDSLGAVIRMSDGGFLLAGASRSGVGGNKTSPRRSGNSIYATDLWVVRTDADGNKIWEQSYGGSEDDRFGSVAATADGGILLGGTSFSGIDGNKTAPNLGYSDYWLLRLDANGEIVWQRTYGGSGWDELNAITPAANGGFLIGGTSNSRAEGEKTSPKVGYSDYWIIRIDANGAKIWERAYGGLEFNDLRSVASTVDGGFLLGGTSSSATGGTKTSPWRGYNDYWLVRINSTGEQRWDETYGGLTEDSLNLAFQTSSGGFIVGGTSDSSVRGNKSAPPLGSSDFWIVQLAAENPEDCDNDRVPDTVDQCLGTPRGDFVNAQGCGLTQVCPCASPWASRSNYVDCVSTNSAQLVADGVMTAAQRDSVLNTAMHAYCPPLPEGVVAFGLTNLVLGGARLDASAEYGSLLYVTEADPESGSGTSVQLGQADSGVFIYPYASIWGNFDSRWFMKGTAYGRVNGIEKTQVSRVRGRKPYYEVYPVEVDLSPLRPTSVTWQVWSGQTLVTETNVPDAISEFTVYSASTVGPRVNPFWRMPDGGVGVMIEFTEPVSDNTSIVGPFGADARGDRIFARANSPSNVVDYVSSVDVVVGGGVYGFEVVDERPGIFGRAHRVLGPALLVPSLGRLQIDSPYSVDQFVGALIETRDEKQLDLTLEPISLTNEQSSLTLSFSGFFTDPSDGVGHLRLETVSNLTSVTTFFVTTAPESPVEVRVYRAGVLQGQYQATNSTEVGTFAILPGDSKIIGVGGGSRNSEEGMAASFTLDRTTTFRGSDGQEWQGDHFQIVSTNVSAKSNSLSALSIFTSQIPTYAITSEESTGAPPAIAIALAGTELVLTWPARNLPLVLESSETLPGNFTPVTAVPVYQAGQYRVTLPASTTGNRFFRLRTAD